MLAKGAQSVVLKRHASFYFYFFIIIIISDQVWRTDPARNDFRKPNKCPRSHAKCHVLYHTPENYPKVPTGINTARSDFRCGTVHTQMRNRREGLRADGQRKYFLILHTHLVLCYTPKPLVGERKYCGATSNARQDSQVCSANGKLPMHKELGLQNSHLNQS